MRIRVLRNQETEDSGVENADVSNPFSLWQVAHAQRHSAKYNLVSAAVATCLMAFILSGCAVVAARIRKRKESIMDYAQLPDTQE